MKECPKCKNQLKTKFKWSGHTSWTQVKCKCGFKQNIDFENEFVDIP